MSHYDATHHTRGTSRYVGDLPEPEGLCHAAIVPSPLAHGKLVRLDSAAALALPEVIAVITAGDIPGENQIGPLIQDEELLASETVHFSGQPLAIDAAHQPSSQQIARDHQRRSGIESLRQRHVLTAGSRQKNIYFVAIRQQPLALLARRDLTRVDVDAVRVAVADVVAAERSLKGGVFAGKPLQHIGHRCLLVVKY